jgi:hypothetical protein
MLIYSFIYQKFKFFSDRVDFELNFWMRSKILGIFKKKSILSQIWLKLKLKLKLTYRLFVENFKCKNSQKQFKSQNIYIFFNHSA